MKSVEKNLKFEDLGRQKNETKIFNSEKINLLYVIVYATNLETMKEKNYEIVF